MILFVESSSISNNSDEGPIEAGLVDVKSILTAVVDRELLLEGVVVVVVVVVEVVVVVVEVASKSRIPTSNKTCMQTFMDINIFKQSNSTEII